MRGERGGKFARSLGCSPASLSTNRDFISLTPSHGEGGEGQHPLAQGAGTLADTAVVTVLPCADDPESVL